MTDRSFYRDIGAGFDRSAGQYDQEIGTNPAMRYMREISLCTLRSVFRPGERVLEIGCGTGEEALALAREGLDVLATDLAPEMLKVVVRKAQAAGVTDVLCTRRVAAGELGDLVKEYGASSFDGAYSSFGPLNGEPDLGVVSRALAVLVRPGGCLVASVMNRFYLLETLWYLAHLRPVQAVRRWKGTALAGVSPTLPLVIPTWYYTPAAFERAFAPAFVRQECRALPLLLPPPFLSQLWDRFSSVVPWLCTLEQTLAHRWPFCALGDHFLMVLQRRETDL